MSYVLRYILYTNKQQARRAPAITRQADPCSYANDGSCDVPKYCPAGDYADCSVPPCSLAELEKVAADPATAIDRIAELMKSNPACGDCLMKCVPEADQNACIVSSCTSQSPSGGSGTTDPGAPLSPPLRVRQSASGTRIEGRIGAGPTLMQMWQG